MTQLSLLVTFSLVWVNLVGLGLLANLVFRDYAVSRVGGPILLCLVLFSLEHYWGLGSHLAFLPFSTVLSGWLIWRERALLRRNLWLEGAFALGFLYSLVWRYAYPDIDISGEKLPDLVFINDYFVGSRLPPIDRWLPPFHADFYYSFQYYAAALLARWFHLDPAISYQVTFCTMAGLMTSAIYAAVSRLCAWRPGRWLMMVALLLGGCGLNTLVHLSMNHYVQPAEICRYLGLPRPEKERTFIGVALDHVMYDGVKDPAELPVTPLNFVLAEGEFHPPVFGFLLLLFTALLLATLDSEWGLRKRNLLHALLAATVPLSLIGNTWIFPLQAVLVAGWFVYRAVRGERTHLVAGFYGAGAATLLAYPFLGGFMTQPLAHATQPRLVTPHDHSWIGWFFVFWPVFALAFLAFWNRERRGMVWFLICTWGLLMVGTEVFYIHDVNGSTWERYNSTLKWWGWIYAGAVLTLGSANLGAVSRFCRVGSAIVILVPCVEGYDVLRYFAGTAKPNYGHIEGYHWLTDDSCVRDMLIALRARPDGICIDSNLTYGNTDATALGTFAGKQSLVGWPVQEGIWRGLQVDIGERMKKMQSFYDGSMEDPLTWLEENNVRYVLWLQKDNNDANQHFVPLMAKIKGRYAWHHFYGNDGDWAIGYWERKD